MGNKNARYAKMRLTILLLFLLSCRPVLQAQHSSLERSLKQLDSLVYFNQFDKAKIRIDQLDKWLTHQPQTLPNKELALRLLHNKAHVLNVELKNKEALEITHQLIKKAQKYQFSDWEFKAHLLAAGIYEQSPDLHYECKESLNQAYQLYQSHKLEHLYAIYCVRISSYYRINSKTDSAMLFANKALDYAKKYNNKREITDATLLLGMLYRGTDFKKSIHFFSTVAKDFVHQKNHFGAAMQYINIAYLFLTVKQFQKSSLYADSAYRLLKPMGFTQGLLPYYQIKQAVFRASAQLDSVNFYLNEYHKAELLHKGDEEQSKIKKITDEYEKEKKEEVLKRKNQQFNFIACLLIITLITVLLVIRKNGKIKAQNNIINRQLVELNEILEVKKVLLSELQHRVKNNLQNIMSILEIQKESVDFNNIDELIRANQNRINSMFLLQQKLDISKSIDHINLEKGIDHLRLRDYINELAMLVRDSYLHIHKNISLDIDCSIEELPIQKAQPLGMIIVELISNSIKHGFKDQNSGIININIQQILDNTMSEIHYTDDGIGFDIKLAPKNKGLGLEIIYGLTDQLNGEISINPLHQKGFAVTIRF